MNLLARAEANLLQVCPDKGPLFEEKSKYIFEDLENFSSKGEALRYPEKLPYKGGQIEPTLPDSFVVNIRAVMEEMASKRERFMGCKNYLDNYLEYRQPF